MRNLLLGATTIAALALTGSAWAANPKLTLRVAHRYIAHQERMYTHAKVRVTRCERHGPHRGEIGCQVYATGPFLHINGHAVETTAWWVDGVVSMEGNLWLVPGNLFTTLPKRTTTPEPTASGLMLLPSQTTP
jgi:hypothetical protein